MYLDCLELILFNCSYAAVIVPSTFWNTGLFRSRLLAWDKIDYPLFKDTQCPVGIAYFTPYSGKQTKIFVSGEEITPIHLQKSIKTKLSFNKSHGQYVLSAIDKPSYKNIRIDFITDSFNKEKYLKDTSRNYVLFHSTVEIDYEKTNRNIIQWREQTKDFYLTSFKSPMNEGTYRKRLSYKDLSYFIKTIE